MRNERDSHYSRAELERLYRSDSARNFQNNYYDQEFDIEQAEPRDYRRKYRRPVNFDSRDFYDNHLSN